MIQATIEQNSKSRYNVYKLKGEGLQSLLLTSIPALVIVKRFSFSAIGRLLKIDSLHKIYAVLSQNALLFFFALFAYSIFKRQVRTRLNSKQIGFFQEF